MKKSIVRPVYTPGTKAQEFVFTINNGRKVTGSWQDLYGKGFNHQDVKTLKPKEYSNIKS